MTRTTKRRIAHMLFFAWAAFCTAPALATQTTPPSATSPASSPASPPAEPPPAAVVLKLRQDLLERDGLIVQLQAQIYQLQAMILEADRVAQMPGIVKAAGGKQGDEYDLKKLALVPAPASATQTPPPEATRKP